MLHLVEALDVGWVFARRGRRRAAESASANSRFTTCEVQPSFAWRSPARPCHIAAVTGHSLKDVEAILDAHYLGRGIQLAEAAMLKLEARTKL
jgi:hypothetical protein